MGIITDFFGFNCTSKVFNSWNVYIHFLVWRQNLGKRAMEWDFHKGFYFSNTFDTQHPKNNAKTTTTSYWVQQNLRGPMTRCMCIYCCTGMDSTLIILFSKVLKFLKIYWPKCQNVLVECSRTLTKLLWITTLRNKKSWFKGFWNHNKRPMVYYRNTYSTFFFFLKQKKLQMMWWWRIAISSSCAHQVFNKSSNQMH